MKKEKLLLDLGLGGCPGGGELGRHPKVGVLLPCEHSELSLLAPYLTRIMPGSPLCFSIHIQSLTGLDVSPF